MFVELNTYNININFIFNILFKKQYYIYFSINNKKKEDWK